MILCIYEIFIIIIIFIYYWKILNIDYNYKRICNSALKILFFKILIKNQYKKIIYNHLNLLFKIYFM